jgi:hypothetical protein
MIQNQTMFNEIFNLKLNTETNFNKLQVFLGQIVQKPKQQ